MLSGFVKNVEVEHQEAIFKSNSLHIKKKEEKKTCIIKQSMKGPIFIHTPMI